MVGRDEWFSINASGPAEQALTKSGATPMGSQSFRVEPEAAPAMRAGFERAIQQMILAKNAAMEFNSLDGEGVNPVVDKYMKAMIDRATGHEGSVVMAADSAIAEYQSVIDQLDRAMAGYRGVDDGTAAKADNLGREL